MTGRPNGKHSAHGGLDYAKLARMGISPEDVLDFSVSVNPFPLPERVYRAAAADGKLCTRYPDSDCTRLRRDIAAYHGLSPDEILPVNGTSQGIFLIAAAYTRLHSGIHETAPVCLVSGPAYGEYGDAWNAYGGRVVSIAASEECMFTPSASALIEQIRTYHPRLVWICEPNNPTGRQLGPEEMQRVLRTCRETGTLPVLDEAYRNFMHEHTDAARESVSTEARVLRLRSMTKDFGIPGLRLGYIIGTPEELASLRRLQPDWSVNGPAQQAGSACLEEIDYFRDTWHRTREAAVDLGDTLSTMGFPVVPFEANYLLMKTGNVALLTAHLWKRLIQVRDCTSFGLPGYVRIGSKTPEENRVLVSALEKYHSDGEYREGHDGRVPCPIDPIPIERRE